MIFVRNNQFFLSFFGRVSPKLIRESTKVRNPRWINRKYRFILFTVFFCSFISSFLPNKNLLILFVNYCPIYVCVCVVKTCWTKITIWMKWIGHWIGWVLKRIDNNKRQCGVIFLLFLWSSSSEWIDNNSINVCII